MSSCITTILAVCAKRYENLEKALLKNHRGKRITEEQYRRVCLWLDLNSSRLGAFNDVPKQEQGELVWPDLDVDPGNITGVEKAVVAARPIDTRTP